MIDHISDSENLKSHKDKKSADSRRMGQNYYAHVIGPELSDFFGPLAVMIRGKILLEPYLSSGYIRDFIDHDCEKNIVEMINVDFGEDAIFGRGWRLLKILAKIGCKGFILTSCPHYITR
ncbi:MAG: hypothetical protein WA137_11245 [Methanothrix sp.]